jgi:hypothetical protein
VLNGLLRDTPVSRSFRNLDGRLFAIQRQRAGHGTPSRGSCRRCPLQGASLQAGRRAPSPILQMQHSTSPEARARALDGPTLIAYHIECAARERPPAAGSSGSSGSQHGQRRCPCLAPACWRMQRRGDRRKLPGRSQQCRDPGDDDANTHRVPDTRHSLDRPPLLPAAPATPCVILVGVQQYHPGNTLRHPSIRIGG